MLTLRAAHGHVPVFLSPQAKSLAVEGEHPDDDTAYPVPLPFGDSGRWVGDTHRAEATLVPTEFPFGSREPDMILPNGLDHIANPRSPERSAI